MLVSSDTDYLPAVEWLQSRGFKVINATWANHGHELARACWASFELDAIVSKLRQENPQRPAARLAEPAAETLVEELAEDPCPPVLARGVADEAAQDGDGAAQGGDGAAPDGDGALQRATT